MQIVLARSGDYTASYSFQFDGLKRLLLDNNNLLFKSCDWCFCLFKVFLIPVKSIIFVGKMTYLKKNKDFDFKSIAYAHT